MVLTRDQSQHLGEIVESLEIILGLFELLTEAWFSLIISDFLPFLLTFGGLFYWPLEEGIRCAGHALLNYI